jgi:hypothetical protein
MNRDLDEDSLNLNVKIAHMHPYMKPENGIAITDKACKWDRNGCGWQYPVDLDKCPECGCPTFTLLKANQRFQLTPRNVNAQRRRELELCWHMEEDPITGEIKRHKYVEEIVGVVSVANKEHHDLTRCKTCKTGYTKFNGRAATDAELAKAQAGEIEQIPEHLAGYGNEP